MHSPKRAFESLPTGAPMYRANFLPTLYSPAFTLHLLGVETLELRNVGSDTTASINGGSYGQYNFSADLAEPSRISSPNLAALPSHKPAWRPFAVIYNLTSTVTFSYRALEPCNASSTGNPQPKTIRSLRSDSPNGNALVNPAYDEMQQIRTSRMARHRTEYLHL